MSSPPQPRGDVVATCSSRELSSLFDLLQPPDLLPRSGRTTLQPLDEVPAHKAFFCVDAAIDGISRNLVHWLDGRNSQCIIKHDCIRHVQCTSLHHLLYLCRARVGAGRLHSSWSCGYYRFLFVLNCIPSICI